MRIKVMADYECPCLWWDGEAEKVGPIELDELPLSDSLKADLQTWTDQYDATLSRDDPLRSGFSTPEGEAAFHARGRSFVKRLEAELGPSARIRYWPQT